MAYLKKKVKFGSINPFNMLIAYNTPKNFSVEDEPPLHIHEGFEIYFNISGNVSFVVENRTYPISSGDVILTKPFEYHHCIYHDNSEHEHYCLQFSASESDELFKDFYERKKGVGNHVRLTREEADSLKRHIDILRSDDTVTDVDRYYHFIRILQITTSKESFDIEESLENTHENLRKVLNRISSSYSEQLTVENLASEIFVSVNTLERYFRDYLNITPREYIKRKRLSEAMTILDGRYSVSQVAYKCGFSNTSNFIEIFKKEFGITPYQHIKANSKKY